MTNLSTLYFVLWNIQFYSQWKRYVTGSLCSISATPPHETILYRKYPGALWSSFSSVRMCGFGLSPEQFDFPSITSFLLESRAPGIRPSISQVCDNIKFCNKWLTDNGGDTSFCGVTRSKAASTMGSHIFMQLPHTATKLMLRGEVSIIIGLNHFVEAPVNS